MPQSMPRGPKRAVLEIREDTRKDRPVTSPKYFLRLRCGHVEHRFLLRGSGEYLARCRYCQDGDPPPPVPAPLTTKLEELPTGVLLTTDNLRPA